MTLKQLNRFIKTRNNSRHDSNLQFEIDARACGFNVEELGPAHKVGAANFEWATKFGVLREIAGRLELDSKKRTCGVKVSEIESGSGATPEMVPA